MLTNAMTKRFAGALSVLFLAALLVPADVASAKPWWQSAHDYSYYRDKEDWKGKFLTGQGAFSQTYNVSANDAVVAAWAYVGGTGEYTLTVNGERVGGDGDNGSIEDYEFTKLITPGRNTIELNSRGEVGLDGEILLESGKVIPLFTNQTWSGGGRSLDFPRQDSYCISQCFQARPVRYTPSQASATHISLSLARIQRMRDQTMLDFWRSRHVDDLVAMSRDPMQPLYEQVRGMLALAEKQIPAAIAARSANKYADAEEALKPVDEALDQAEAVLATLMCYNRIKAKAIRLDQAARATETEGSEKAVVEALATLRDAAPMLSIRQYGNLSESLKSLEARLDRRLADLQKSAGVLPLDPMNHSNLNRVGWVLGHTVLDTDVLTWEFMVSPAIDQAPTLWHGHPAGASVVTESRWEGNSGVRRQLLIASALSPAVLVASDFPTVRLSGWTSPRLRLLEKDRHAADEQTKRMMGTPFAPPNRMACVVDGKVVTRKLADGAALLPTAGKLDEPWLLLFNADKPANEARPLLVVLTQRPTAVSAAEKARDLQLDLKFADGVKPLLFLLRLYPAKAVGDEPTGAQVADCRRWTSLALRYPIAYSETARPVEGQRAKTFTLSYEYLQPKLDWKTEAVTLAPLPVLADYGMSVKLPGLATDSKLVDQKYATEWGRYTGKPAAKSITYTVPDPKWRQEDMIIGACQLFPGAHKYDESDESFQRMASWGMNHSRPQLKYANWDIPLVNGWTSNPLSLNEDSFKRLDSLVRRNNAAGLCCMINMFDDGYRANEWRRNEQVYKNAVELWRQIAKRYAALPAKAVMYDLVNEPRDIPMPLWNKFIKETVAAIREVDKTHTIVLEAGEGHANPWDYPIMIGVDDDNVIYSFHHYEWAHTWKYVIEQPDTKAQLHYPRYLGVTADRKPDENGNISYNSLVDYYDIHAQEEHFLPMLRFVLKYNTSLHCGEMGVLSDTPIGDGKRWCDEIATMYRKYGVHWSYYDYMDQGIWRFGLWGAGRQSRVVDWIRPWLPSPLPKTALQRN